MIEPSNGARHAEAQRYGSRVDVAESVENYCYLVPGRNQERVHVPGMDHFAELYISLHLWEMA